MELLGTSVVNMFVLSSMYILMALGFALLFSIMGILNFAHGAIYMVGGYICYQFAGEYGLSPWTSLSSFGPDHIFFRANPGEVLLPAVFRKHEPYHRCLHSPHCHHRDYRQYCRWNIHQVNPFLRRGHYQGRQRLPKPG